MRNFGLLFVVGEERNSAGALAAAQNPRGSRFLINGEPTENQLALGSKGALRYEIIAHGKMAHSAYPELGESAIDKLLNALERIRKMPLPVDDLLGPSTLNIGTIQRRPRAERDSRRGQGRNVHPRRGRCHRTARSRSRRRRAARCEANEVLFIPAVRLGSLDGFETTVVAYTTDIPAFDGRLGQAISDRARQHSRGAHERRTHPEKQLLEAVDLYEQHGAALLQGQQ